MTTLEIARMAKLLAIAEQCLAAATDALQAAGWQAGPVDLAVADRINDYFVNVGKTYESLVQFRENAGWYSE
jgi:Xaa-Pro aminopeptidase